MLPAKAKTATKFSRIQPPETVEAVTEARAEIFIIVKLWKETGRRLC